MNTLKHNEQGFGAVEGILIVVVLALIGGGGWLIYKNHNKTTHAGTTTASTKTSAPTKAGTTSPAQTADPYAGWKTYSNAAYGIGYKYPTIWTTSGEVTSYATTLSSSATKQEFSTGLKLTTDTKYSNTVDVEVLDESIAAAATWYDNYYAQSSLNKVTKKSETLKEKQAVSYDVTNSGNESKLYLFSVGSKTYAFGSVNEELNIQHSSDYWANFQKVFDSLTLQ